MKDKSLAGEMYDMQQYVKKKASKNLAKFHCVQTFVATKKQFCCPRDQGLGRECTRAHFFKALVLVLPVKVLVLRAKRSWS